MHRDAWLARARVVLVTRAESLAGGPIDRVASQIQLSSVQPRCSKTEQWWWTNLFIFLNSIT